MLLIQKILFSKEECDVIITNYRKLERSWNKKDRSYKSYPISYSDDNKWIFSRFLEFFESVSEFEVKKLKGDIHFHNFIFGDWFGKHDDNKSGRLYAVGSLLNDDFEGGDFIFYNSSETLISKIPGNSYVFDVRIPHEVKQITLGSRYSLLWFLEGEHLKCRESKLI